MQILIPTAGRANMKQQATLRQLIDAGIGPTLVVQASQHASYQGMLEAAGLAHGVDIHALPAKITTVSPTRDYIIHDMSADDDKVLMLDDDLHFAVRRQDDRTRFRQPGPTDIRNMVAALSRALDTHPMVGIGAREGGNRVTEAIVYNTRLMRVMGFRRSYLRKRMITFSPMELMEDFHVELQVLRSGADVPLLNNWVSNQAGGSNATGGCSVYRTPESHKAAAHALAGRHPGFVRVVQKTTKTAWGGTTRTDVIVSWKKAAAAGKAMYGQQN